MVEPGEPYVKWNNQAQKDKYHISHLYVESKTQKLREAEE
jgi:hypothetical protein